MNSVRKMAIALTAGTLAIPIGAASPAVGSEVGAPAHGSASAVWQPFQSEVGNSSALRAIDGTSGPGDTTTFTAGQTEVTVLPSSGSHLSADELASRAPSIACSLNIQNVHGSTHVAGTINGVAVVSCSAAAGSLTLHYSLIRTEPNYTQWAAGDKSTTGKPSLQNNRAVPCSQGPANFRGWAQGVIAPPPGYVLTGPAKHADYGRITNVSCGANFASSEARPTLSESTTITFVREDLAG